MAGSEAALSLMVRRLLTPFGLVKRVENRVEPGMPDLVCCLRSVTSWVELKHAARWPARPATPLRLRHLTTQQVAWANQWSRAGGRYALILQVERDYLLFCAQRVGSLAAGTLTQAEIKAAAEFWSRAPFPTSKVVRWLS